MLFRSAMLEEAFGAHGTITELKLIKDRDTGRSKGFAFISFEDQGQADNALALDGTDLDGRTIKVNPAKSDGGGARRSGGGGRGGDRNWN